MYTDSETRLNTSQLKMTIWNFCKLDTLLAASASMPSWRAHEILAQDLQRSVVMDDSQIPSNVATMRSRVEFRVAEADMTEVATLVYPGECHMYADAISVLTPVGSAILGLAEGQSANRVGPDGTSRDITILRVLYQPEAARRQKVRRFDEMSDVHNEGSMKGAQS